MVNEQFAKWACGFSGCDGGNLHGKIWLCGIEFGGGHAEGDLRFDDDVTTPGFVGDDQTWGGNPDGFLEFRYNQRALKLLGAFQGKSETPIQEFFKHERCFRKCSDYFKLNLYPIAFRHVNPELWHQWIADRTGLKTKDDYLDWCRVHRFRILRTWAECYSPKIIICTGVTHRDDFFKAFVAGFNHQEVKVKVKAADPPNRIQYVVTNTTKAKTIVAVTYFLGGPKGLISNEDLKVVGETLRKIWQCEFKSQ